ncbi:hypothetical protein V8C34DRAFT_240693 [Trichoderma compactum]
MQCNAHGYWLALIVAFMDFICALYNDICYMAYVVLTGTYRRVNSKEMQTAGGITPPRQPAHFCAPLLQMLFTLVSQF